MIENENEVVEQEVVEQDVVESVEQDQPEYEEEVETADSEEDSEADSEEEVEAEVAEKKETEGWRSLRLAKIKAEKERDDLRSFVEKNTAANQQQQYQQQQYQQQVQQQQQPQMQQQQPQKPKPSVIDNDAIVSGSDLNNQRAYYENLINESNKKHDARFSSYDQKQSASDASRKLLDEHNDFFKVVTNDNLLLLKDEDPRLYDYLNSVQGNIYDQGKLSYKYIKMLNLDKEDTTIASKNRIKKNARYPRSSATINPQKSKSSLSGAASHANRKMSQQEKMDQRRKMKEILGF